MSNVTPRSEAANAQLAGEPTEVGLGEDTLASSAERGAAPAGHLLERGRRIDNYVLVNLIGRGGMGEVWQAEQLEPVQRFVALKFIRAQFASAMAVAFFQIERQMLANMQHPAIAQVFDAGSTLDGQHYLVMELVDGAPLLEYAETHKLNLRARLALFIRLCAGVQHAHQRGVIHRDIKPANVLVSRVDGGNMPKLIDFGIALSRSNSAQGTGERVGTGPYMSPEQRAGEAVDTRSDVYALGITLLELIAPAALRRKLQVRGLDTTVLRDLLAPTKTDATALIPEAEFTALRNELRSLPWELRALASKALSPDRAARYVSVEALGTDLKRYLGGYPLNALSAVRGYRLRKFVVRQRLLVGASAITLLALVVGLWLAIMGLREAKLERDRAHAEMRKSEKVSIFLTEMLGGADPKFAQGLDNTLLKRVLERAAQRASGDLSSEPEVLARVERVIGATYTLLGERELSLGFTLDAYQRFKGTLGPSSRATWEALRDYLRALDYADQSRKALDLLTTQLPAIRNSLPESARVRLSLDFQHIWLLRQVGNFSAAAALIPELRTRLSKQLPAEEGLLLDLDDAAAVLASDQGRMAEAEVAFRDLAVRYSKRFSENHPSALSALQSLAITLLEQKRFPEALAVLEPLLVRYEKVYESNNPTITNLVGTLASAYRKNGDFARAEPLFVRATDDAERILGADSVSVAFNRHNRGNFLYQQARYAEALVQQDKAVAVVSKTFGSEHPVSANMRFEQARARAALNMPGALEALEASFAQIAKISGLQHPNTREAAEKMADFYAARGAAEQAAKYRKLQNAAPETPQ